MVEIEKHNLLLYITLHVFINAWFDDNYSGQKMHVTLFKPWDYMIIN